MKRKLFLCLLCCSVMAFVSCNDKEDIGLVRDIDLQYDGDEYDLSGSDDAEKRILHIYRNNGDQYVNYRADQKISLNKGTYHFVAALPIDSGMPVGNVYDIVIPLPTTATQKLVITDPTAVKMPGDESVTLNMKTRTGTIVIDAVDVKADRRYNSIDIRTTVYQNGYKPGSMTYVDGETDILKTATSTTGGVNFRNEFYVYPTKDENSKIQIYLDFYNRSSTDTVLIKQQMLAEKLSVEAGRTDTIKIFLNTDDYINQNYVINSSYDEWSEETIKPTIVPEGYTYVSATDDLVKVISDMYADDSVDAVNLYLQEGSSLSLGNSGTYKIEKSLHIIGEKGDSPVELTVPFLSINSSDVDYVKFEGLEINCKERYLFNMDANVSWNLSEMSLVGCTFYGTVGSNRGIIILNTSAIPQTIDNFIIDDCILYYGDGGYGLITGNGANNILANFVLTRSTLINRNNQTFFRSTSGMQNIAVKMVNNTFVFTTSINNFIDVRSGASAIFTFDNNLFTGSSMGSLIQTDSKTTIASAASNYCTEGWTQTNANLTFNETGSIEELFEDFEEYDLTIKDKSSAVYVNGIGDPRWIK